MNYNRFKPKIIKNTHSSHLPPDYSLFKHSKQFQQNYQFYTQCPIKRQSLNSLKLNSKFLSRLISYHYKLNHFLAEMFSQSLILYTKVINDSDISDIQSKKLMNYINDKYDFINSPQLLGLMIGNLIIMRNNLSKVIQKIHNFAGKNRDFCDFSGIMYYKMLDMMNDWCQYSCPNSIIYVGWQHYQKVESIFDEFYYNKQKQFNKLWTEFKLNKEKNQPSIVMLINKITNLKEKTQAQINLQLFGFLFLVKFLVSQHNYNDQYKVSQTLIKTLRSIIGKLCYIMINIDFKHMNWFLTMYKYAMGQKEFFGDSRIKMQLGLSVSFVYFYENRAQFYNQIATQFCDIIENKQVFKSFKKELVQQFPLNIASLTLLTQSQSKLLSYGTPFNQRRRATQESLRRLLTQNMTNPKQKTYIPQRKLNQNLMLYKSQILKYAEQRIQNQEYLQLYVSLQEIYLTFRGKLQELPKPENLEEMWQQKVKDLQTWFVGSYLKIFFQLKSVQSNSLYTEGYMPLDFISHLYYEIISRIAQQTMVDINYESLYTILFEQYSIQRTIVLDVGSERFGAKELLQAIGNKESLAGSSLGMYGVDLLRKYYNMVSNGVIAFQRSNNSNDYSVLHNNSRGNNNKSNTNNNKKDNTQLKPDSKKLLPIQLFISKTLSKKELLFKKRQELTESQRKREKEKQKIKIQGNRYQTQFIEKVTVLLQSQEQNHDNKQKQNNKDRQLSCNKNKNNKNNLTNNQNTEILIPPPPPKQNDQYAQQFLQTEIKSFVSKKQPTSTIPFYFIKSQIFRLIDYYLKNSSIKKYTDRVDYQNIFSCLVIVIDNQAVLMDIYANVLFNLLSDSKQKVVQYGYDSLSLVRMLHRDKYKHNFKHSQLARKEVICIFQKLRKIEIKRNRQRNKSYIPSISINSGKQKGNKQDISSQQHSKVYMEYFQQLFRSQYHQILSYGRQLFTIRKYKQCTFVLEVVRQQMEFILKQTQNNVIFKRSEVNQYGLEKRQYLQKMMAQCDLLLSDCYSTMVRQFHSVQGFVNERNVYQKLENEQLKALLRKERMYDNKKGNKNEFQSKKDLQKTSNNLNNTLTSTLTRMITTHYTQLQTMTQSQSLSEKFAQSSFQYKCYQEKQFRSSFYSEIYDYCTQSITAICTVQDLKIFYTNVVLGGTMLGWYQQKYLKLMDKWTGNFSQEESVVDKNKILTQQFPDQENDNPHQSDQKNFQISAVQNPIKKQSPKFQELIHSFSHTITSKIDKFYLINMINTVQCLNKQFNFQTIRMVNQSLLETKKESIIFAYLKRYYDGVDKFENMSLLDLELLQKFHYQNQNYQHVKAITKFMRNQQINQTYGEKQTNFPNWPQVFGYELIAKIYDLNCRQNPEKYWKDLNRIIAEQKFVVVQGLKLKLQNLKRSSKMVQNIQKKSPKIFAKLVLQLENKIKHYFNLLRIIFSKLSLSQNQGSLQIFEIMQKIYQRMFIPGITKDEIHIDFFLYFLRFLCEKVNPKYFIIRQAYQENRKKMKQESSQANQEQVLYAKKQLMQFLLSNLVYVKHHTLYMIRSMDSDPNTQKNVILRDILVQIFANNPVENLWTLTYLKYYEKKMPDGKLAPKKTQEKKEKYYDKKKQKIEEISRYVYPQDSQVNQLHNASIQQLYKAVCSYIDPTFYSQLTLIPITFMQWLQKTATQRVDQPSKPNEMLYFVRYQNIQKQRQQINKKIRQSKYRIPYPFDHKLYIKSVQNVKLSINQGKSIPSFVSFSCGLYSEFQIDKYKKTGKSSSSNEVSQSYMNQPNTITIEKHILLKNNFSHHDHRIETNTANFYKHIGLLDQQTTYGIINLTKYILIIQKICVPHKSLRELISQSFDIDYNQINEEKYKFLGEIKKQLPASYLYEPKLYDKSRLISSQKKSYYNGSMFYHFYNRSIQNYNSINEWWAYMQNYVRTLAYWSYASFVTKLGDRHLTNILISNRGKFIHIDYEYNFGLGLLLPYPELTPFRLTDLIIQPLGTFKQKGLFFAYFVEIAKIFNPNEQKIWKALCHFSSSQRQMIQETSQFQNITKVNKIEQKCQKVIDLAKDSSLLRLMFQGWSPEI